MFENLLAKELYPNAQNEIWIEDESQRIGNVNIPQHLWNTMRQCPVYFLQVDFEDRLNNIVKEYGCLPHHKLEESILRIQKRLGGLDTKKALLYLNENRIKDCFSILLKYYDKYYDKGLRKRENWEELVKYTSTILDVP
jgi:tRNA 2-selenouridine synthase